MKTCRLEDLKEGEGPAENAAILKAVLEGETGPRRDITLLNAAPAIVAGEGAGDLAEGIEKARESIDTGAARACLGHLVRLSQQAEE